MGRWAGSWLSGPEAAAERPAVQDWPGQRLGLPAEGSGSVPSLARRSGAFLIDAFASALVAAALVRTATPELWSLAVFVVEYVVLGALTGQSAGMRLTGLRVVRVGAHVPVDPLRWLGRTTLLVLLVPALIWDSDRRGMHDRATGTMVTRL